MKNTSSGSLLTSITDAGGESFLVEMEGDPTLADSAENMPPEPSGDDRVKAAFRAAVVTAFDDDSLDMKATLARIKEILAAHDKLAGGKQSPPADSSTGETPESYRIVELESRLALMESERNARVLLESAGVEAAEEFVEAVALLNSPAKQTAFVKHLPRRAKGTPPPRVSQRPSTSPPIDTLESTAGEDVPDFSNTQSVVSFLRGNG